MLHDSPCDTEQMKSQGFEASRLPRDGQGFSFHEGDNMISEKGEPPPGCIGKESFRRENPACEIILEDIMNPLHAPASFSLPLE
jgi:hypothetical protein